jgi:hypothetical protein
VKAGTMFSALVLPLWLSCGGAAGPRGETPAPLVKTTPVAYTRVDGNDEATLELNESRGLLSLRAAARQPAPGAVLPTARRVELWKPLLEDMLRGRGRRKEYRVVVGDYPELPARIAAAAACSGQWDFATGKPRSGEPNATIQGMLADGSLTPELKALFESLAYSLSVRSVEKVLLCRWKEIQPGPPGSCRSDVKPESQVPCGASILFQITSKE